jgi:hypothetical protein
MNLYINFVQSLDGVSCERFKSSKVKMAINDNGIIILNNFHKLHSLVL